MSASARALGYPHVEVNPAVSGGQPVVEGTRIPVATLVRSHQLGMDFDEVLLQYPVINPVQLHAAFVYYFDHRAEIESLLREAEAPPEGAAVLEL
jgi:uncharacterized protein (DUF433 family)